MSLMSLKERDDATAAAKRHSAPKFGFETRYFLACGAGLRRRGGQAGVRSQDKAASQGGRHDAG